MKTTKQILFLLLLFAAAFNLNSQTSETLKHIKTIAGEISPKSIVHNDKGKFFAQNMMYRHTITVYDRSFNKIKTISDEVKLKDFGYSQYLGTYLGSPVECAFSHDGKYAWISNYEMRGGKSTEFNRPGCDGCSGKQYDNSFVYKINTSSYEIEEVIEVGAVPKFLAVTPNNKYVLVSNWTSGDVSVIDTKKNKEIKRIPVGRFPRGIDVNNRSTYAYVAVMGSDKIAKINLINFKVSWIKDLGSGPRHICISPDDQDLYVSINNESKVLKIDLNTHKIKKIKTGIAPRSMTLSDDGKFLYVVNYQSNTMSKIETQNMDVVDKHSTGTHPIGITFDGAKKNIWVACYTGNIMIFHDGYYDEKENESAPLIASRKGNSLLGIAGRYIQPAEETPTWSLREMADIVEETKKEINVYSYNDFLDEENKLKSEEVKLKKLEEESLGAIRDGQKALEEKRADLLNKTILEAESYNNKEKSEAKDNLFDHASKSIELANQLKLMRDAKKKQLAAIKKNKEELLFSRLGEAKSKKEAFLDSKNEEYQRHKKNSIALANFLLEKEKNLEQLAIENKEKRTAFLFKKIEEATEYKKELNKKLEEEKEESVSLGKSLIEKSKIEAAEKIREENIRLEKLKDAKLKEEATKRRKEKLLKEKEERKSIDKEENKKDQFELLFEYLEDAQKQQDKIKKNTLKQIEKHTEESLAYAELVYEEQQKRKALEKLETVNSKEEDRLAALEQKIARKDLLSDIKDLQKEYNEHIKQSITYAEKLLAKIEEQEKVLGEKIIAKESKKQLAEMKSLEKVTTTSTKETKEEKEVEKPKEIKKATQKIDTKIDEGAYYAVVGSYGEKKHAIRKQKKFIKKGFDNTDIIYNKSRGLYYVFVNQFDSREATQDYADEKGIDVWIFNKK